MVMVVGGFSPTSDHTGRHLFSISILLSSMAALQPSTRAPAVGQELNLFVSSEFKQVHKLLPYTAPFLSSA